MNRFDQQAHHYDQHAHIQRHINRILVDKLEDLSATKHVTTLLDLGSGTGHLLHLITQKWPEIQTIGLDLSHNMQRIHQRQHQHQRLITADAACPPIATHSMHAVLSSFVWQWLTQPAQTMRHIQRILRPNGFCLIAAPGPKTLFELQLAWQTIDDAPHFNAYPSAESLIEQAHEAGLKEAVVDTIHLQATFKHPQDILRQIKAIGANALQHPKRKQGLMTPRQAERLWRAYEPHRLEDGRYSATYEVLCLYASKAPIKQHMTNALDIPVQVERNKES